MTLYTSQPTKHNGCTFLIPQRVTDEQNYIVALLISWAIGYKVLTV